MRSVTDTGSQLIEQIRALKKEKNAVILAHYYQKPEVQDIADFVGDSLALAEKASSTRASVIVFAGVHFMAETAKILNPSKEVLFPDPNAGCSLADSCPPDAFADFLKSYPGHCVVSYINCSAAVKALSHVICTSSNARKVIQSIPAGEKIVFAPDKNLGGYLKTATGRDMVLWDGVCEVHQTFSLEKLRLLQQTHPSAILIAHPECTATLLAQASFVGSTSALLQFVARSRNRKFLVATEAGVFHQMQKAAPGKILIPVPMERDNSCACGECAYMKLNDLEKIRNCLINGYPRIHLSDQLIESAAVPLRRMMAISGLKQSTIA